MRQLDLDQPEIDLPDADAPSRIAVKWNHDGEERTTIFHTKRTLDFGRESTGDVCLRVEPVDTTENRDATLKISRLQFRVSVEKETVHIVDLNSAWGTHVDSMKLEPNKPFVLRGGETVIVADFFHLVVRIELESGKLHAVRFRRVGNLPGTEYVCLVGQGTIDIGGNALIRLPVVSSRQGRAFDIGQNCVATPPATLLVVGNCIHIKRTGSDSVKVGQLELAHGQSVPLPTEGIIQVNQSSFNIKAL
ncbi:MAG: FHA domain-containing protein [Thermoguttaceae bacterium]